MFKDEGEPVKILTLGYLPSIGNFLFRHNILDAESDNIFDYLQGIQVIRNVNYMDFNWPKDCTFVYNSFNILVYRGDELYARIRMGITGNLIQIEFVHEGYKYRTMFFDCRGFLNPEGEEFFRNNKDDSVTIFPNAQGRFKKSRYDSITEMISEYLDKYFAENLQPDDAFIIAATEPILTILMFLKRPRWPAWSLPIPTIRST